MKKFLLAAAMAALLFAGAAIAEVNVNTASQTKLESLPGIGKARAAAIIAYRKAHGDFGSLSELANVEGIGEATVADLKGEATVGDAE